MAIWQVEFSKDAYKVYQKIGKAYQKKVDKVLTCLVKKKNVDIKPVKREKDIYRLRIGKYRILLTFLREESIILVAKIGPRGDVYK